MRKIPDRWTAEQKSLYMKLYRFVTENQNALKHPDAPLFSVEQWDTTSHNLAWSAAELLERDTFGIMDEESGQVVTNNTSGLDS